MDGGTLQQLRNLINRRNISASASVSGRVNLELIIRCHVVAFAMHYFSMGSVDDEPHTSAFPANVAALPLNERWKLFFARLCQIVDKYIVPKQFIVNALSTMLRQC